MGQKVERSKSKKGNGGGRLWLPRSVVAFIPKDARFECELTEEGILFRHVTLPKAPANLPSWTNGHDS
jgi:hypothetical protein